MGKLKAVTIIETVVAMLIIVIVFFTTTIFFLDIEKSGVHLKKLKATEIVNNYFTNIHFTEIPEQRKEPLNGFIVEVDIKNYASTDSLAQVQCRVYDSSNKLLAEQKRLCRINKQEN